VRQARYFLSTEASSRRKPARVSKSSYESPSVSARATPPLGTQRASWKGIVTRPASENDEFWNAATLLGGKDPETQSIRYRVETQTRESIQTIAVSNRLRPGPHCTEVDSCLPASDESISVPDALHAPFGRTTTMPSVDSARGDGRSHSDPLSILWNRHGDCRHQACPQVCSLGPRRASFHLRPQ